MEFAESLKQEVLKYREIEKQLINDQSVFLENFYSALLGLIKSTREQNLSEHISEITFKDETEHFQRQAKFYVFGFNIKVFAPKFVGVDKNLKHYDDRYVSKIFVVDDSNLVQEICFVGDRKLIAYDRLRRRHSNSIDNPEIYSMLAEDIFRDLFQTRIFHWSEFSFKALNNPESLGKIGFAPD